MNNLASISVRKIDDNILKKIKLQAVHHGVSMEEEVRYILTEAVKSNEKLSHAVTKIFSSCNNKPLIIPKREINEPIEF